jgi:hypothetical protein
VFQFKLSTSRRHSIEQTLGVGFLSIPAILVLYGDTPSVPRACFFFFFLQQRRDSDLLVHTRPGATNPVQSSILTPLFLVNFTLPRRCPLSRIHFEGCGCYPVWEVVAVFQNSAEGNNSHTSEFVIF